MSDGTQYHLSYSHGGFHRSCEGLFFVGKKTTEKRNFSKDHWSARLSKETRVAVQAWAEKQPDKPSLSQALERLVETGVSD